jgi:hypothetical protein
MSVVTVGTFDDALLAHIAKGRLEAEGIVSYIMDEHYIWANWSMSFALGGVKIRVKSEDAQSAKEVLLKLSRGEYQSNSDENVDETVCSACNSHLDRLSNGFLIKFGQVITYLIWGVVVRIYSSRVTCKTCGRFSNDA